MSRLRADTLTDRTGTSAPDLTHGATSTSGTFSGDLGGGDVTLSGNASVDGTLTYQDADNINSTGIITARQGIQVSANGFDVTGISTFNSPITVAGITTINESGLHATGVITATSFAGDGSGLTGTNRTVSLVASGTLSNGQTVIVTSDGKAKAVVGGALTETTGAETVFEPDEAMDVGVAFDSNNNKVVVVYSDVNSNADYFGTAVVGTVTGIGITFGPLVKFANAQTRYPKATFDSSNNKIVVGYRDVDNSNYGTAIVGTVSGDSISFGTEVVFESASTQLYEGGITFDSSNNKVVISYKDLGNSNYGTAIVGTVSGTSISFGSPVVFNSANTPYASCVYDPGSEKVLVCYRDYGGGREGRAKVGTVSGTSISFGSAATFQSNDVTSIVPVFDSTNNKILVAYRDLSSGDICRAAVGTVSGTSISFGTPVDVYSAGIQYTTAAYDSNAGKVVISFEDMYNNVRYGTSVVATISDTTLSLGSTIRVWNPGQTTYLSSIYDSSNKRVVIAYNDGGNTNNGTAVVFRNAYTDTNLTSENFIGFSDAAYSDGDTATVQIITALDDAQSGLTTGSKHYVQNDGTLSTTAGSPSVLAGTAISDTEIIVKQ